MNHVSSTASGLSDTESMPCSINHLARSGWSEGPWPQIPTYLPFSLQALIAIGQRIGSGAVKIVLSPDEMDKIQEALTAVTACGFPNALMDMRLATTSPALVRYIKQQAPGLRVTLLAQLILPGTLDRRQFDALGLRHNRISAQEVRLAALFGYEIHAWTVNDRARMSALIDLGVDAIITDYPDRLHALTEDRRALSDGGLMLVKLLNWLRQ